MTKTFFVCAHGYRDNHVGEDYDDMLFVEDNPSTVTIQEWVNKIRDRLRRLWNTMPEDESERVIRVHLDAAPAYGGVLSNLQILMDREEQISLWLAFVPEDKPQPIKTYLDRYGSTDENEGD